VQRVRDERPGREIGQGRAETGRRRGRSRQIAAQMQEIAEATTSVTGGDTLIVLVRRIVRVALIMTLRRRYVHGMALRIAVAEQGSQSRRNAVQWHHG
jgi:hypothetical protein